MESPKSATSYHGDSHLDIFFCPCPASAPGRDKDAAVAGAETRPCPHLPLIAVFNRLIAGPGRCSPLVMGGSATIGRDRGGVKPVPYPASQRRTTPRRSFPPFSPFHLSAFPIECTGSRSGRRSRDNPLCIWGTAGWPSLSRIMDSRRPSTTKTCSWCRPDERLRLQARFSPKLNTARPPRAGQDMRLPSIHHRTTSTINHQHPPPPISSFTAVVQTNPTTN